MIYAKHNETEYKIKFFYDPFVPNKPRETLCVVEENETVAYEAVARCAAEDNFCKSLGRKLALERAIQELDKPVRKTIWAAFHKMTGHEGWIKD
jgi:hypothetical protein